MRMFFGLHGEAAGCCEIVCQVEQSEQHGCVEDIGRWMMDTTIREMVWEALQRKDAYKYRVINDITQESFIVEGPSLTGCRLIADAECERRGWKLWDMRSEEIG